MIFGDHHIHTHYSKDADPQATFLAYIKKAKELGLKAITFTDHHDIDPAHPLFKIPIDFDTYIEDFLSIPKDDSLQVRLGVEIGYQKHVVNEIKDFLNKYPFQYVILSVHYIEKKDLYTGEYFKGKTQQDAYQMYFETCLEAIQSGIPFDTLGHLDYIPRYAPYGDYEYASHKQIIDTILLSLIQHNKHLEINTSGFLTEKRMYPKIEVIKRYIELGGTRLILGSDAHNIKSLGQFFNDIPQEILNILK